MIQKRPQGLFIVGTDTEVGKTFVSALIARELHRRGVEVGVYKPVASGCADQPTSADAVVLWHAAGQPKTLDSVTPQRFVAPLAPNVAARLEGRHVDSTLLRRGLEAWEDSDVLIVEGVGGLLSPLSDADLVKDLAVEFGFPVLMVVPNQLGCINHALLTTLAVRHYGMTLAGIVLNDLHPDPDFSCNTNQSEIERLADAPFVTHLPYGATSFDVSLLTGCGVTGTRV